MILFSPPTPFTRLVRSFVCAYMSLHRGLHCLRKACDEVDQRVVACGTLAMLFTAEANAKYGLDKGIDVLLIHALVRTLHPISTHTFAC